MGVTSGGWPLGDAKSTWAGREHLSRRPYKLYLEVQDGSSLGGCHLKADKKSGAARPVWGPSQHRRACPSAILGSLSQGCPGLRRWARATCGPCIG